jgi:hypothetical protein
MLFSSYRARGIPLVFRKGEEMRRAAVLIVVAAAMLALAGGVVLAESKTCATFERVGTREADTI